MSLTRGVFRSAGRPLLSSGTPSKAKLKLIECPRDAMQGLRSFVPTASKITFINTLLRCGFDTIDCGSFVSPNAVPQMRDTAAVLAGLDSEWVAPPPSVPGNIQPPPASAGGSVAPASNSSTHHYSPLTLRPAPTHRKSKLLVVVANVRGAEQAAQQPSVHYVGFPMSVSETFQQRNTRASIAEGLKTLEQIQKVCERSGKTAVAYLSMAFGNPYGDAYSPEVVVEMAKKVASLGLRVISLADTVGAASPDLITQTFRATTSSVGSGDSIEWGVHLHAAPRVATPRLVAAYDAGCRRFDHAFGGMGGCPYAADSMTGNVPSELVIRFAADHCGLDPEADLGLNLPEVRHAADLQRVLFGVDLRALTLGYLLEDERALDILLRTHFDQADATADGRLGRDEFEHVVEQVFKALGEEPPVKARIAAQFERLADGGDGVSFDAYREAAKIRLSQRMNVP
eukprot:TRINITY_DN45249_c0_g1_i1.p1 TRINITY_DN45249_c0_g1~~TRINITY_DN45249_c0_g1_i1.p1  ORF type:complete len:456 (+),score=93.29 TRINITY_DN45249_c0_g1_i1:85-1452(+)